MTATTNVLEQARHALERHDRTYMMSDSRSVYQRGIAEAQHICELLDQLTVDEVAELADEYFVTPIDLEIAGRFVDARAGH